MADTVALQIAGRRIENLLSYRIEADLYTADDAFSLELANPEVRIAPGQKCELYVNGALELVGIIDRVRKGYDKNGTRLTVEGRDLMGILVDAYAEDFVTIEGKTVQQLAEMVIGKTGRHPALPFISREQIIYQENFVGKGRGKKKTASQPAMAFLETPQKIGQITPGMTVFELLRNYAMSRGLMFWLEYRPDGPRFVFGRPKVKGAASYFFCNQRDGRGNNVLDGERTDDISKRYSKVTVITQQQGHDDDGLNPAKVNPAPAIKPDPDFPFYKPFVQTMTNDSQSPALHARLLLEKMRHDGLQLVYRVPGHSQAGLNYAINELAQVRDEALETEGTFLVFGRTFEKSKQGGTTTSLRLGLPGLVA